MIYENNYDKEKKVEEKNEGWSPKKKPQYPLTLYT